MKRQVAIRCLIGGVAGLLIGAGYHSVWNSGSPIWPFALLLFFAGAAATWNQQGRRWIVALSVWLCCMIYVDQSWRRDREAVRRHDPYSGTLRGLQWHAQWSEV